MQVSIEVLFGKDAVGEVVLDVEYTFRPGSGDYFSASYGNWLPGDPPEMEIQHIYWPCKRYDREKKQWVDDHFEPETGALPDEVYNAIETHIIENHVDDYEPYDI